MKYILFFFFVLTANIFAQETEKINIPKGIVYNYCDSKIVEKAKKLIAANLSNKKDYKIVQTNLIIGPMLWKRFKDNKKIQKIEKGNVEFHVDNLILNGKMSQTIKDSKIIWEEFRKEVSQDYKIRKANEDELNYYWSVISFDIDEPLLIIETKEHNYILNLLKKDLKLMWLDEAPRPKAIEKSIPHSETIFKKYQNGEEIQSVSKGLKETKLETVVLLDSDQVLRENTSLEDIESIIVKTDKIFEELFKKSEKSGKIMILFELKKDKNDIQFAVRDNLDLEIMKEFEKRINAEKYPNSKKEPIKIKLIYKVNSFNDTE